METRRYIPTLAWEHALATPDCPRHHLLLAVADQQPIGWCRIFPVEPTVAEIGIGLRKPYRDRGNGSQLLHDAIAWATQARLACLTLTARVDNARALHVFHKLGFAVTERRDGMVHMARSLDCSVRHFSLGGPS